jgi:hypothetical protein
MSHATPRCQLVNETTAPQVLNLPHAIVPECATMGVVGTTDHDTKTGERPLRARKGPISGSVTLMPKGMKGASAEVPRTALHAPDVKAAIAAKRIRIAELPAPAATAPAPASSDPAGKLPGKKQEK